MENAGSKCVLEARKRVSSLYSKRALVLCGKGNNGGDGLVIARLLHQAGCEVRVIIISPDFNLKGDAQQNLDRLQTLGIKPTQFSNNKSSITQLMGSFIPDLVFDAIFGIGLSGEVSGIYKSAIDQLNDISMVLRNNKYSACPIVISVDCPSGIDSDSGKVLGAAVRADLTVTFTGYKFGLLNQPGASYAGEVVLADVGIDEKFIPETDIYFSTSSVVRGTLKARSPFAHKGDFGTVLIIAGSSGMAGAAALAAKAAFFGGAGLVRLVLPSAIYPIVATLVPEATYIPISARNDRYLDHECVYKIMDLLETSDVLLIGPGLGRERETGVLVRDLIKTIEKPFVLDADGIFALAENIDTFMEKKAECVLTPHPGELSRLVGEKIPYEKRLDINRNFARNFKLISVLKGSRTLITSPDGETFINLTGNSGMATGGSGDVLAGLITSLIGQGNEPFISAAAGAYIHGLSGDIAAREKGEISLTAMDILNFLPAAFMKINRE